MSLLSGATAARRWSGILKMDRETVIDRLNARRFTDLRPEAVGPSVGWTTIHNLCDTDFDTEKCWFNQYLVLTMRRDTKRPPAKLVASLLELRCKAWMAEAGRERVPAPVRAELKELLLLELLPKTQPTIQTADVIWDTVAHRLWLLSSSDSMADAMTALLATTFQGDGVIETVEAVHPLTILNDGETDGWMDEPDLLAALNATGPVQTELTIWAEHPAQTWMVEAFLIWLWWMAATGEAAILGGADRIDLYLGTAKMAATGDSLLHARPAARKMAVSALGFFAMNGERQYSGRIMHGLVLDKLVLPTEVHDGIDERIYERMFLLDELFDLVAREFRRFARLRLDPGPDWPATWAAIEAWLADGDQKAHAEHVQDVLDRTQEAARV